MPQPKRLAITIAGAVSLGSYEAGVLYEVVHALGQHNERHKDNFEDCVVIDVITGASAGGMTAAIATQKLLFEGDRFVDYENNPFYDVWVKGIDLKGLQNTQADENPLHSIYSSDLIAKISGEELTARYDSNPMPGAVRHGAAAQTIRLGLAMTNLNGVDYGFNLQSGGQFVFTDHRDQITREIDGVKSDNLATWAELRGPAVACGAFPIAFRAQELVRKKSDYPGPNLMTLFPNGEDTFVYTDGGVLQNQPLGMAKNLVDEIDNHEDNDNRFYLFVSPHGKLSDAVPDFREADANYIGILRRLAAVVMQQSTFQDWIDAEDMNKKLKFSKLRAEELKDLLVERQLDPAALDMTAKALLKAFSVEPGGPSLEQQKQWTTAKYAKQIAQLPAATEGPFIDSMLAFEKCAGLEDHDSMQIYGITAAASQLAGAGLFAFLGFFDQAFRQHDYDRGRLSAIQALKAVNKPGRIDFDPENTPMPDPRLDGLKLKDVPDDDRDEFESGLKERADEMMRALGWWERLLDQPINIAIDLGVKSLFSK